jgi:Ca2+:H+ antiporter
VGTSLLLVAAFGLLVPSAFYASLKSETSLVGSPSDDFTVGKLQADILSISRATSIALIVAFCCYIWFSTRSQHSLFDEVIQADEENDADHEADAARMKFTMTETLVALAIALALVSWLLFILVEKIEHVVASGVPDQFLGLILLPLVEKAAEHLTAIDEAWGE